MKRTWKKSRSHNCAVTIKQVSGYLVFCDKTDESMLGCDTDTTVQFESYLLFPSSLRRKLGPTFGKIRHAVPALPQWRCQEMGLSLNAVLNTLCKLVTYEFISDLPNYFFSKPENIILNFTNLASHYLCYHEGKRQEMEWCGNLEVGYT